MAIIYVDLENGNDANDGTTFANRKKTIHAALNGAPSNTEVRVMGKPTNLVGSCFFAVDSRNTNFSSNIAGAFDNNGQIEISTNNSVGWSTGDWIIIENTDLAQNAQDQSVINGVWNIELGSSSGRYILVGSDSSVVTTWTPADNNLGDVFQADGFIFQLDDDPTDGPYVKKLSDGLQWVYNVAPPDGGDTGPEEPAYPEWLKTYTELRSQTISGVYGLNTQLATTEATYGGPIEFGPQSKWEIITTSTGATVTTLEWTSDQMLARDATGVTVVRNGSHDDGFYAIGPPWSTTYNGYSYTGNSIYFGTNSYITFGGGYTTYSSLSAGNPYVRKIHVGGDDNSAQYIVTLTEGTAPNRVHRARFEGRNSTSGTVGFPNIVFELQFFENDTDRLILLVDQHARYSSAPFSVGGGGDTSAPVEPGYYPFRSTTANDITPIRPAEQFNIGDGSPTNGKLFHSALPSSTDLSSFTKLCFLVRRIGGTHLNDSVSLRLCSDTSGDTSVYTIPLPNELSHSTYGQDHNYPVTFNFPSAPSTNIQSIALYSDTTNALNASYVISGIIATRNGLSYECVLGENVAPGGVRTAWYQPLLYDYRKKSSTSTDYTTVILLASRYGRQTPVRRDTQIIPDFGGRPDLNLADADYVGNQGMRLTYTSDLYSIDTIRGELGTTVSNTSYTNDTNINASNVRVLCGYNESDMTEQNGYTVVDKFVSTRMIGVRLSSRNGNYIERLGCINAYYALYMSAANSNVIKDCIFNGHYYNAYVQQAMQNTFDGTVFNSSYFGLNLTTIGSQNIIRNCSMVGAYYTTYINLSFGNKFINSFISSGKYCLLYNGYSSGTEFHDCVFMNCYGRGMFTYYSDTTKIYGGKMGPFRQDWGYISNSHGPMLFDVDFQGYVIGPYLSTTESGITWRTTGVAGVTNRDSFSHNATVGNDEMYHHGVRANMKSITDTLPDGSSGRVLQVQTRSAFKDYQWAKTPAIRAGFNGGEEVTVTVPIKRSSTTSVNTKLSMRASSINGLDDVLESSWASGASATWDNLSLTFTPVIDGIIEIDIIYYFSSTSAYFRIGPVTVE